MTAESMLTLTPDEAMNEELIRTADIARLAGVTEDWCRRKYMSAPDFPKPAIRLSQKNRAWRRADVERWIAQRSKA